MAGPWAIHVTRRRGPLWMLLFCCGWAMGAGAAAVQMVTPYKAEVRCSDRRYLKYEYGKCCAMCPPGKYADQLCTVKADTECRPCPRKTFTEVWNYVKGCRFCSECDAVMGFEEDSPCSATNNTKCKCKRGTHCEKTPLDECVHCTQHTECPAGTEVTEPGTMHSDTQCAPCKEGYYQSKSSLEARCRQHTDCRSQGLQLITNSSAVADSVCAPVVQTETPPIKRDTSQQESNYKTLFIVFGMGILIIAALLIMFILIRTPSVCKEIGKFFHREDRQAELDRPNHTDPLLMDVPIDPRSPMEDPLLQRRIIAAGHNLKQPCVVVEPEHLQQNAPSVSQRGGPYLQETGPTSPSVSPCPSPTPEVLPGESNTKENLKATKEGMASSDRTPLSAGPNSGVQIQGAKITYNGNIYIYQVPAMPPLATEGSVPPIQVSLDPNDVPTSIPEQGTPPSMKQVPLPFCQGPAAGWHCIAPQQEEGKDMHLATEERLTDTMCPVDLDSSLYVGDGSETGLGQYKQGSPEGEFY